jgi:serralysin
VTNPYTDALIMPSVLDIGGDRIITYAFGGTNWTAAEMAAFVAVFAAYEAAIDIDFVEADAATAEFVEFKMGRAEAHVVRPHPLDWSGWHDTPGEILETSGQSIGIYVIDKFSTAPGSVGYWLAPHEIGHALGLNHPHGSPYEEVTSGLTFPGVRDGVTTDAGNYGHNSNAYTVMSYRNLGGVYAVGPMAFDIAALQSMYGANLTYHTGDDTYALLSGAWRCIWDAGGIDTLTGTAGNDVIDLRQASLLDQPGGGGWLSYRASGGAVGGVTIANGVIIENATGGGGSDTITGNSSANRLTGAALNDVLSGLGGADILNGGSGSDTFYLGSDSSVDIAIAGNGDTIRQFDSGEDKIDLRAHDATRVWVTADGADWQVNISLDADAAAERWLTVVGSKPLASDILW